MNKVKSLVFRPITRGVHFKILQVMYEGHKIKHISHITGKYKYLNKINDIKKQERLKLEEY